MEATLPVPPHGALAVVKAAGDPSAQMARVAAVVSAEPTLTATLLRLVNSAAYGIGRPIGSVQQASTYLGMRAIRNIAVHHVVRSALNKVDVGVFDTRRFWEDSLRRGVVAQILARRVGLSDPSEAFTAGLMQDLGTLILAARYPGRAAALQEAQGRPAAARLAAEEAATGETHPAAFAALGRAWGLPADLIEIVALHHDADASLRDPERQRLLDLIRTTDVVADAVQTEGADGTLCRASDALTALASREPLSLDQLLDDVAAQMRKVSGDLDVQIGAQPSWQNLILSASRVMMRMNEDYEAITKRLEEALATRDQAMADLQKARDALNDLAHTDALTGVLNRRAFMAALDAQMRSSRWPAAVLMVDLDHFKSVNDRFGHGCGDDVLQEVARRCRSAVRVSDAVGRIGGEEFAILMPGCATAQAREAADRVCAAVRAHPVDCSDRTSIPVSASVGGSAAFEVPASGEEWLRRADEALYRSKAAGRDRVSWASG